MTFKDRDHKLSAIAAENWSLEKRIKNSLRTGSGEGLWRSWRNSSFWSETNPREKPILLCRSSQNVVEIFQKLEEERQNSAYHAGKGEQLKQRRGFAVSFSTD